MTVLDTLERLDAQLSDPEVPWVYTSWQHCACGQAYKAAVGRYALDSTAVRGFVPARPDEAPYWDLMEALKRAAVDLCPGAALHGAAPGVVSVATKVLAGPRDDVPFYPPGFGLEAARTIVRAALAAERAKVPPEPEPEPEPERELVLA